MGLALDFFLSRGSALGFLFSSGPSPGALFSLGPSPEVFSGLSVCFFLRKFWAWAWGSILSPALSHPSLIALGLAVGS